MKDRRKFLKNAGSTALFASLGSSFFISCDESDDNVTHLILSQKMDILLKEVFIQSILIILHFPY